MESTRNNELGSQQESQVELYYTQTKRVFFKHNHRETLGSAAWQSYTVSVI